MARTDNPPEARPANRYLTTTLAAAVITIAAVAGIIWYFSLGSESAANTAVQSKIPVPAGAEGPARAASVEVIEPYVDFGRVSVDKVVDQAFVLRNTGADTVKLGKVGIELLEGC